MKDHFDLPLRPGSPASSAARSDPSAIPVLWVSPQALRFKLRTRSAVALADKGEVFGGDWDLDRVDIEQTAKFKSVVEHFRDGIDWEGTALFQRYAKKLARGKTVRGCETMGELSDSYRTTIDPLYLDMRDNGFVLGRGNKQNTPVLVYIGRDGDILLGQSGNHRFAMARTLNLDRIGCRVLCRHADWQALREKLADAESGSRRASLTKTQVDHPDLQDLLVGRSGSGQTS